MAVDTAPNRVRELREASVQSLRDLAGAAGVSHVTISRVESGEVDPHPSTRRAIAKALGEEHDVVFPAKEAVVNG